VPGEHLGATAVVGPDRVRAAGAAPAHHDRRALALEIADLLLESPSIAGVLEGAAGHDDGVDALAAQHLQVPNLTVGVAERVAEHDQRAAGRRHLLDPRHDLSEKRIGDIVNDDADDAGRGPAQSLRVRVADVTEFAHRPPDLGALHLGYGIAAVQHARDRGRRDAGMVRHVADRDAGPRGAAHGARLHDRRKGYL
jgi:hypothetical protein